MGVLFSKIDQKHLRFAIRLAEKGPRTSPNPRVGALIARGNTRLATGFHRGPGTLHAEIEALAGLSKARLNSQFMTAKQGLSKSEPLTLYVTLEPCCHLLKRTPPCTDAILKSPIERVVIGVLDPNPEVSGRGIEILKSAGLDVEVGCLTEPATELIRFYTHWMHTRRPYRILKAAMSLDGKIATKAGESRWITGLSARKKVHQLRGQVDAVLVASRTVLKDDPELTVRLVNAQNPLRIVLDSKLQVPIEAKVFQKTDLAKTLLVTCAVFKTTSKIAALKQQGVELFFCDQTQNGNVDLDCLWQELGRRGLQSVLIEAGAGLASAIVKENEFDEISLFIAPKILGGAALDLFRDIEIQNLHDALGLKLKSVQRLGEDLWTQWTQDKTV